MCHGRRSAGCRRIPAEHVLAHVTSTFQEGKQLNQHILGRVLSQNEAFYNAIKKPTKDDCDPLALKKTIPSDWQVTH